MSETIEKLRDCFEDMVVYKDLKHTNFFSALSLPSFLRDWLLRKFEDEDGTFDAEEMAEFVRSYIPRRDEWNSIKNRIVYENERVKFLTKVHIDISIKTQEVSFSLPDYGLETKETIIEPDVWDEVKDDLIRGIETWGVVELGYRFPMPELKQPGKIKMVSFQNFCPYTVDLDYFKEMRAEFTMEEWINVLLGAIDYNTEGYENEYQRLTMLTRLLPFVEKRLNLIELAPKGTGKSYLFGQISKFGWLSNGGTMTRAKMFYDMGKRVPGLVGSYDYVALDEVQATVFPDGSEMRTALQGYLESGKFTVGNYSGIADAGLVLLGNIDEAKQDEYQYMFGDLPSIFHVDGALLDRFHGFIKGWDVPRMHDDLKICGWALNSEYFCSIMHLLRDDANYRAIVDRIVRVPEKADTRDTEAIKRITTAYMKLLMPHVRSARDVNVREFKRYCLSPAMEMRHIVRMQIGMMDSEYRGKDMPELKIKEELM